MRKLRLLSLALITLLPACATELVGQQQSVTLRTEPDRYSKCIVDYKEHYLTVSLPTTTEFYRTAHAIKIHCVTVDGDAEGDFVAEPHVNEWGGAKGAILGLGIGWAYDRLTDAAYDYPNPIIIPLTPKAPTDKKE